MVNKDLATARERLAHYERKSVSRTECPAGQYRPGSWGKQCSEKALVAALAQMYVLGVSTRKVAAITEELCGHEFSDSSCCELTLFLASESFSHRL